jgi:hypothetical protein
MKMKEISKRMKEIESQIKNEESSNYANKQNHIGEYNFIQREGVFKNGFVMM